MATALDVVTRKAGQEYHQEPIPALGGVDYDSNDSTIDKTRFRELHNFRISNSDDIELRTGHKEYLAPSPLTAVFQWQPVGKMEYVLAVTNGGKNVVFRFDVTALWEPILGTVALFLVNKTAADANPNKILGVVDVMSWASATEPIVGLTESQNSIVVTVFGDAVYEAWKRGYDSDLVDRERVADDISDGLDPEQAAKREVARVRPKPREISVEQLDEDVEDCL